MLCLLLVGRIKKRKNKNRKEKWPGAFFPRAGAGHALLAVVYGIFMAIRCN
jgi:hypothetical protein